MIEIEIEKNSISVKGHANYAEPGKDIVCAAVSTLFQAFIASVEELTADVIIPEIQPGNSLVRYAVLSPVSLILLNSFIIGVDMIADEYPDNVRVCKH
jgi:uncharacterized protein YsxB (DUF464 family)